MTVRMRGLIWVGKTFVKVSQKRYNGARREELFITASRGYSHLPAQLGIARESRHRLSQSFCVTGGYKNANTLID